MGVAVYPILLFYHFLLLVLLQLIVILLSVVAPRAIAQLPIDRVLINYFHLLVGLSYSVPAVSEAEEVVAYHANKV